MASEGSFPHPADAATAEELSIQLRRLKAWSGLSFRELERRARVAGDVLPISTSWGMLNPHQQGVPRVELIVAFTRACGCTPDQVTAWVAARRRIAAAAAGDDPDDESADPTATGHPRESDRLPPSLPETVEQERRVAGRARRGRRWLAVVAGLLVLAVADGAVSGVRTDAADEHMLLSDRCPDPMMVGTYGVCAQELQRQLHRQGLDLPDDAWFGPFTKQRVMIFQTLMGLPSTGMADHRTKRALLDGKQISPSRWTSAQTERRLRKVFSEDPDRATELARCLSLLDPLWIMSDRLGTRRWGLFQFSDLELKSLRAEPATALNPEWNIQTAHKIWRRTKDFRHWSCRTPTGQAIS
ncbi:peptidoglycan-binding protein [Streptosporangium soli]|nr:peptidoglycan-binding protein [Streptosporangium sp. KLBMP 9127]